MLRKLGAVLLLLTACTSLAHAETFTVSNSDASGSGSLPWAVNSVNALDTDGNIISFDASVRHITLQQELTINKSARILGGGATLTGSGRGRLFTITNGHIAFDSLTFTKGYAVSDNGGAVKVEGSNASAEFNNCTFFDNQADNYGGAVCITNGSTNPRTTLTHCTLAGNLASNGGGLALINGEAAVYASIIVGNSYSNDIYCVPGAIFGSWYNIIGSTNTSAGTGSETGYSAKEVLLGDGKPYLEEVNGVEVLKLSGTSPARDFIPTTSGYGFDTDETGNLRPMLSGYDAGAVEALPVPVQSVDISGLPYIQVNASDKYSITILPEDASRNITDYPPDGIRWRSSASSVLSVDNSGNVRALGTGSSYLTAEVHGWNADGSPATFTTARALRITVGEDARKPKEAKISRINDVTLNAGQYMHIKPTVSVDINGILIENVKGGTDYALSPSSSRLDIVMVEVVSGDTLRLLAGTEPGSCDVTVTVRPLPSGNGTTEYFSVNVVSDGSGDDAGHSSGGGGCDSAMAGITLLAVFKFLRRKC
ncbi:MAG: hypothetical protein IJR85_03445 [Synergistaceae bacterium]|nr:hypothetical protein [Synergistaceae bacterium]